MNKKFLSAILFGALMITSTGSFVSCKDYDEDIDNLQGQITKNESAISALQSQATTLQSALSAAQSAAAAAQATADKAVKDAAAAQGTANQAVADAAAAKEAGLAAAATAKAEAIAEALKMVNDLKAELTAAINKKVDYAEYAAKVLEIEGKIAAIDEELDVINGKIGTINEQIVALQGVDADLQEQINALVAFTGFIEKYEGESLLNRIGTSEAEIAAIKADLAAYKVEAKAYVDGQIADVKAQIAAMQQQHAADKASLEQAIAVLNAALNNKAAELQSQIDQLKTDCQRVVARIDSELKAVRGSLDVLNVLISKRLTSIELVPEEYVDGIEAISFTSLVYNGLTKEDGTDVKTTEDVTKYALSSGYAATAYYNFNPATFDLADADYGYIDNTAVVRSASASKFVKIVGTPVKNSKGQVEVTLKRINATTQPKDGESYFVALQATLKGAALAQGEEGVKVTSPFAMITEKFIYQKQLFIADKAVLTTWGDNAHYATTVQAAKAQMAPNYTMPYTKDKVFNLKEKVATCIVTGQNHANFDIDAYELSYKFALADDNDVTTGATTTDQAKYVECTDAIEGLFATDGNASNIGRQPIFRVDLVDKNGKVVRRGFVKVLITADKAADIDVPMGGTNNIILSCPDTKVKYEFTEEKMWESIYHKLGIDHTTFWNMYKVDRRWVAYEGVAQFASWFWAPEVVDGQTQDGRATKKIVWEFQHRNVGKTGNYNAYITLKNTNLQNDYPMYINFWFVLSVTNPTTELAVVKKNEIYWEKDVAGEFAAYISNVNVPATPQSPANECQFATSLSQAYVGEAEWKGWDDGTDNEMECYRNYTKVEYVMANGEMITSKNDTKGILRGVQVKPVFEGRRNLVDFEITLDKRNAAVKEALNSENGLQAMVTTYSRLDVNGYEQPINHLFVSFICPVNMAAPKNLEVTDAVDSGCDVDFVDEVVLADWRGYSIVAPEWAPKEQSAGMWRYIGNGWILVKEGYYKVVTDASYEVATGAFPEVGSQGVKVSHEIYFGDSKKNENNNEKLVKTISAVGADVVSAKLNFNYAVLAEWSKLKAAGEPNVAYVELKGDNNHNAVAGGKANEEVFKAGTYSVILTNDDIDPDYTIQAGDVQYWGVYYVPAVYEWVPAEYRRVTRRDMPAFDGSQFGQVVNDWEWIEVKYDVQDVTAGQYWNYYGIASKVIGESFFGRRFEVKTGALVPDLQYDIDAVTTSLEYLGNKLPSGVTLEPTDLGVKYVNVQSPVQEAYEITIPVSLNYGWGTLKDEVKITVNPAI